MKRYLVYCHANGKNIEETIENVGIRKLRKDSGLSVFSQVFRELNIPMVFQRIINLMNRHIRDCLMKRCWDTSRYLNFVPALFEKVRETFGDNIHLLHDVHHRCTPIEAARLAKELEPLSSFLA